MCLLFEFRRLNHTFPAMVERMSQSLALWKGDFELFMIQLLLGFSTT